MNRIVRLKVLVGLTTVVYISLVLLLLGFVEQANVLYGLAGIVAVSWVVWTLLCIVFPTLKRKKEAK